MAKVSGCVFVATWNELHYISKFRINVVISHDTALDDWVGTKYWDSFEDNSMYIKKRNNVKFVKLKVRQN